MPSPLERLAWSSLTERAAIARVANELLRRNIDGSRGEKGTVKDAVRASCPPRGKLGSRFEGVMRELKRQDAIRRKRAYKFPPYVWHRASVSKRRTAIAQARLGDKGRISGCSDVRTIPGHAIYVVSRYDYGSTKRYLVVKHFASGQIHYVKLPYHNIQKLGDAVAALHPKEISRALQRGGFYTIDICRMVTTIHPLDAESYDLHWEIETDVHPIYRPNLAQCENWA